MAIKRGSTVHMPLITYSHLVIFTKLIHLTSDPQLYKLINFNTVAIFLRVKIAIPDAQIFGSVSQSGGDSSSCGLGVDCSTRPIQRWVFPIERTKLARVMR